MANDVTSTVVGKVMDLLVGVAKREIGYMWNCSANVKTLKVEVETLTAMKETRQQRIDVARHEGKDPGKDLESWMKNADVKISEATKLITDEDESKKTCVAPYELYVNLGTLYRYGKMATKETSFLLQHKKEADVKQIIEAIEDDKIQIVGINGIGGVGKTTLAKEVAAKMKNLFADIVFIEVSHTVDYKMIKESVKVAARKIIKGEKVLIILDNMWEKLKLEEAGIPRGSDKNELDLRRQQAPEDGDVTYKREGILQLKLSYDYLQDKVAKSCFLLCSMFPAGGTIGVKSLTYYGLALGIFSNPYINVQNAKDIVQGAVDSLKSSFLLLPEREDFLEEELFKMHDLVRDMANLITSEGNDKFWVRSGIGLREWQPEEHLQSCKKVSLMGNKISKLLDHELAFPDLDTLFIQHNDLNSTIPPKFLQGMEKLKVLDMSYNRITLLPQSLKQLTELRMLDLSGNEYLCHISILGELTCLVVLKLRSTGIWDIPEEIGELSKLRVLDVSHCEYLRDVAHGVI
ncbi:putative disease resistance protein At1g61190 [Bidens hawaiensis]|uniref:putative disease resistance protein At1g61190 n=1 Tax=Bidens hawaiensis TaxID=980011 RepID=UPI00404A075A